MVWTASILFLFVLILKSENHVLLYLKSNGLMTELQLHFVLLDGWVQVPICFALHLGKGEREPLKLYVFGRRRKPGVKGERASVAPDFALRVLRFCRVRFVHLRARIGLQQDAALTAGVCGALQAVFFAFFSALKTEHPAAQARVRIAPCFSSDVFQLALSCMITCPLGHIMRAAVGAGISRRKGARV